MSTAATFALKSSLRKGMLKTLKGMSDGDVQRQSESVLRILKEQEFFNKARSVGCYLSMKHGELRTDGIVDHLLQRGKSLYTPYIPPHQSKPNFRSSLDAPKGSSKLPSVSEVQATEPEMKMLKLYNPADLAACPLDKWGILDPGLERRDVEGTLRDDSMEVDEPLDLILIPGVAFDEECNRLGRGKAYYDRFLLSYTSKKPSPLLVALALSPQILPSGERVPTTELDFRLDGVISPEGIVWRARARSGN
ncbi:5-formyltetrahydrofolate cyclo-ligase [Kwoniella heveanensis BCC8398]|uniref:5-formyltetrahydrofolate cyclo-ligase n=1 Tax=Kwoniella heveanensis BCC8398 TaxID=1296120 RepID=A0A1B9GU38_9TREE|nr:5-formyltetrahydrofolate cyclo-ligase [Kwoniella heveanensis BCC8398]